MVVVNPMSITFDGFQLGGESPTYQLLGPYVIDKSFDSIRLVVDVIVVTASIELLQQASELLEDKFRTRLTDGQSFSIAMSSSVWTYTVGSSVLKVNSTAAKTGNPDYDREGSRAYTITIVGELPADGENDNGLRDIEALVDFTPSRQEVVTFRGTYTATTVGDAKENYEDGADDRCSEYLDVVNSAGSWEMVDETYTLDREGDGTTPAPHELNFTRQYVRLLANQSAGALDDSQIYDHRISFSDLSQYPGDSRDDARRLRRVAASYECAVAAGNDLRSVYRNKVRSHLRSLFVANFNPSVFGIEDARVSYDDTTSRISVTIQFIYQDSGGEALLRVSQAVMVREVRTIDYTPTHEEDEYAANADVGFAVLERVWTRTATVMGNEPPKSRIIERARSTGALGRFDDNINGQPGPDGRDTAKIQEEGWNVLSSTSQVAPQLIGNPDYAQVETTVLTEAVIERYHRKPGQRTSTPVGPSTLAGT